MYAEMKFSANYPEWCWYVLDLTQASNYYTSLCLASLAGGGSSSSHLWLLVYRPSTGCVPSYLLSLVNHIAFRICSRWVSGASWYQINKHTPNFLIFSVFIYYFYSSSTRLTWSHFAVSCPNEPLSYWWKSTVCMAACFIMHIQSVCVFKHVQISCLQIK